MGLLTTTTDYWPEGTMTTNAPATNLDYRREGDYGTRNKYEDYRKPGRQAVESFQQVQAPATNYAPPELQLGGIFGDWGSGSNWNGLLNMPENNFSYESQGFNYEPQPFNYTPQSFSYEPQPFTYDPKKFGGV